MHMYSTVALLAVRCALLATVGTFCLFVLLQKRWSVRSKQHSFWSFYSAWLLTREGFGAQFLRCILAMLLPKPRRSMATSSSFHCWKAEKENWRVPFFSANGYAVSGNVLIHAVNSTHIGIVNGDCTRLIDGNFRLVFFGVPCDFFLCPMPSAFEHTVTVLLSFKRHTIIFSAVWNL